MCYKLIKEPFTLLQYRNYSTRVVVSKAIQHSALVWLSRPHLSCCNSRTSLKWCFNYYVLYSIINVLLSIQYTFTHIIIRYVVNLKGILPSSDPVQLTPNGYYNNITIDTVRPHPLIIQNPILFIPL